jgi:hypothetical protein
MPENTPASQVPVATLQPDQNGKLEWKPDQGATCPLSYQPPKPRRWINRLTFTFSIGSDF